MFHFQNLNQLDMLSKDLNHKIWAIGNFDGVHQGHRAVLSRALLMAKKHKTNAAVMTFEPHPRSFFQPENPLFRLTNSIEKSLLVKKLGFEAILHIPFDAEFSKITADDFMNDILKKKLNAKGVVIGYDFHFGHKRSGSPQLLLERKRELGMDIEVVEKYADEGDDAISSSRIRAALREGDILFANALLGYYWFCQGVVQKGAQRGRELGFPTANIKLPNDCALKFGIYAVRVELSNGKQHAAVASFGSRPQFDNGAPLLETYIPNFSQDLYGKELRVYFLKFLRAEEKFHNINALIAQMHKDTDLALSINSEIDSLFPSEFASIHNHR